MNKYDEATKEANRIIVEIKWALEAGLDKEVNAIALVLLRDTTNILIDSHVQGGWQGLEEAEKYSKGIIEDVADN